MKKASTIPVEIIPADPADAPAILALQRLAYQAEARLYDEWSIPPLTQTLEELRAEFATLAVLKAMCGGELVGSVRAGLGTGPEADLCFIGRLIVHPERQRQGIGTALLRAAEASFPSARRFQLFTGHRSAGNLRLYERMGYRPVRNEAVSPRLTLVFLERAA